MMVLVQCSALSAELRGAAIGWRTGVTSVGACAHTLAGQ